MIDPLQSAPVAIGGVGGSGTRAVAAVVQGLGYFIGKDLNPALDNLWFTLIFKRPDWFRKNEKKPDAVTKAIQSFVDAMTRGLSIRQSLELLPAAVRTSVLGNNFRRSGRGLGPYRRLRHMGVARPTHPRWGWKEPNTHIYLPFLTDQIDHLRYIHVIRHGLEMATSPNVDQVCNWGWMFSIRTSRKCEVSSEDKFNYWLGANRSAIEVATHRMSNRFLLVDFDRLCKNPSDVIREIADFLFVSLTSPVEYRLAAQISPPSRERYRNSDLSWLSPSLETELNSLGYRR